MAAPRPGGSAESTGAALAQPNSGAVPAGDGDAAAVRGECSPGARRRRLAEQQRRLEQKLRAQRELLDGAGAPRADAAPAPAQVRRPAPQPQPAPPAIHWANDAVYPHAPRLQQQRGPADRPELVPAPEQLQHHRAPPSPTAGLESRREAELAAEFARPSEQQQQHCRQRNPLWADFDLEGMEAAFAAESARRAVLQQQQQQVRPAMHSGAPPQGVPQQPPGCAPCGGALRPGTERSTAASGSLELPAVPLLFPDPVPPGAGPHPPCTRSPLRPEGCARPLPPGEAQMQGGGVARAPPPASALLPPCNGPPPRLGEPLPEPVEAQTLPSRAPSLASAFPLPGRAPPLPHLDLAAPAGVFVRPGVGGAVAVISHGQLPQRAQMQSAMPQPCAEPSTPCFVVQPHGALQVPPRFAVHCGAGVHPTPVLTRPVSTADTRRCTGRAAPRARQLRTASRHAGTGAAPPAAAAAAAASLVCLFTSAGDLHPQPALPLRVRKERAAAELYLRRCVFGIGSSRQDIDRVCRVIRMLDWADASTPGCVARTLRKAHRVRADCIPALAELVASVARYRRSVAVRVGDLILEQIRLALEACPPARDGQPQPMPQHRRLVDLRYLGQLYVHGVVEEEIVFETLYSVLYYAGWNDAADDFVRVRMVITLLSEVAPIAAEVWLGRRALFRFLPYFYDYLHSKARPFPVDLDIALAATMEVVDDATGADEVEQWYIHFPRTADDAKRLVEYLEGVLDGTGARDDPAGPPDRPLLRFVRGIRGAPDAAHRGSGTREVDEADAEPMRHHPLRPIGGGDGEDPGERAPGAPGSGTRKRRGRQRARRRGAVERPPAQPSPPPSPPPGPPPATAETTPVTPATPAGPTPATPADPDYCRGGGAVRGVRWEGVDEDSEALPAEEAQFRAEYAEMMQQSLFGAVKRRRKGGPLALPLGMQMASAEAALRAPRASAGCGLDVAFRSAKGNIMHVWCAAPGELCVSENSVPGPHCRRLRFGPVPRTGEFCVMFEERTAEGGSPGALLHRADAADVVARLRAVADTAGVHHNLSAPCQDSVGGAPGSSVDQGTAESTDRVPMTLFTRGKGFPGDEMVRLAVPADSKCAANAARSARQRRARGPPAAPTPPQVVPLTAGAFTQWHSPFPGMLCAPCVGPQRPGGSLPTAPVP
eukprot:TRINITY_DN6199_c0_g2_i8.p1 TRINITY_DN6199_c0_g2~~TRINITY_DN6199_c0_g2_i8.p1  ORF type:complete len:1166 (+),score=148.50 TRINITY_DN6199_c0_g2_i8:101-3598(+)